MDEINTEIHKLNGKIEEIELLLKKHFKYWTEDEKEEFGDKVQLRKEKERLRKKEEQLRKKEEQLRKEKEQLMELLIIKGKQQMNFGIIYIHFSLMIPN
jgi:FtsZ-interacting cell division protein YlmF